MSNKILSWVLSTDPTCFFCQMAIESRDHLFFQYPFTWRLWCKVAERSDLPPSQFWDMLLCFNFKLFQGTSLESTWFYFPGRQPFILFGLSVTILFIDKYSPRWNLFGRRWNVLWETNSQAIEMKILLFPRNFYR